MHAGVDAEKLGGGSCPNRGPTAMSSSTLSHCLATVSSHAGLRYQLWIFSLRLQHNKNSIVKLMSVHQRTQTKLSRLRRSKQSLPEVQHRGTASTNTPTQTGELSEMPTNQKCTIMTNVSRCSQPACLCQHSCRNKDARQMRMMDQETRHAPKGMLTSIGARPTDKLGSRIATRDLIGFDRVRTAHCVSSVPFNGLRWLHLSMGSQVLLTVRLAVR